MSTKPETLVWVEDFYGPHHMYDSAEVHGLDAEHTAIAMQVLIADFDSRGCDLCGEAVGLFFVTRERRGLDVDVVEQAPFSIVNKTLVFCAECTEDVEENGLPH